MGTARLRRELSLPVKGHEQKDSTCGWASLKMVLDYYQIPAGEMELYRMSGSSRKDGADADDIIAVAENSFNLKGVKWNFCELSDIAGWLSYDVPVIVNYWSVDDGHYAVAFKMERGKIWLQDPQLGKAVDIATKKFRRNWHDCIGEGAVTNEDYITRRLIAIWNPEMLPGLEPYDEPNNKHKLFNPPNIEARLNAIGLHYLQR
jgi:ABC-type bacteriocin/lantibiotic exporter with double-glycine peptidase domain